MKNDRTKRRFSSTGWRQAVRVGCLVVLCLTAICESAGQSYTITDLGTLGGNSSAGFGINASGQVTGSSSTATNSFGHAFVVSPPYTSMVDLGIGRADFYSFGASINSSGDVTGGALSDVFVMSSPYTTLIDLGNFGGTFSSTGGYGINASGQITGWSFLSGNGPFDPYHAFIASPPYTSLVDLGTLGGTFSGGYGINTPGQITGSSATAGETARHAFVMSAPYSAMVDIGTLGGNLSDGFAINDFGQITGESTTATTTYHAFVISPPYNNMTDLGTLGGSYSAGKAINILGDVVGTSYTTGDVAQYAFLYIHGKAMVDLNTLLQAGSGWTLVTANAINDAGQITGYGISPGGDQHAYVLTPQGNNSDPGTLVRNLIATVRAMNITKQGRSFENQLQQVESDITSQNGLACSDLNAFANHVKAQAGKSVTTDEAQTLLAAVASIESALNCGP